MKLLRRLFLSSLGKKFLMAVSGAALFAFVIGHMLGNLQVFLGPDAINAYAHFLQTTPEILWTARLGLLAMVTLHVWSAIVLTVENRAARPVPYDRATPVAASYASRTMIWSGAIVAAFVIYHLLHYTVLVPALNLTGQDFAGPAFVDGKGRHDVYRMVIVGFRQPVVAGFYIVAVSLLCLHLGHGVSAMFQSLGLKNKTWGPLIDRLAMIGAGVLWLGYLLVPVAVLLGFGKGVLK